MRTARSSPNEQDSALQEMGRGPSAPSACLRPPGAQFAIFECAGYSYISRSRSRLTATASCRTSVIWMLSVSIAHYTPRDATLAVATLSLHQPQGEKQARYNDKTKTENEPTCVRNRPRKADISPWWWCGAWPPVVRGRCVELCGESPVECGATIFSPFVRLCEYTSNAGIARSPRTSVRSSGAEVACKTNGTKRASGSRPVRLAGRFHSVSA